MLEKEKMGVCTLVPSNQTGFRPVVYGMGILVSDREVITCAHVINKILGDGWQETEHLGTVRICFPFAKNSPWQDGTVDRKRFFQDGRTNDGSISDIAVITFSSDAPSDVRRALLRQNLHENAIKAYGFRGTVIDDEFGNRKWVSHLDGEWVDAKVTGLLPGGRAQLDGLRQTGATIERGYSGAGVYDPDQDAVVGMVVEADQDKKIKTAQCIDAESLRLAWSGASAESPRFWRGEWVASATEGALWRIVESGSVELCDRLRALIQRSEDLYLQAQNRLEKQRWCGEDAPVRVVRCLASLLGEGRDMASSPGGAAALTATEAAIVIVAPYLYEAVLAISQLKLLEDGDPFVPDEYARESTRRLPLALRHRFEAESAWARRRAVLTKSGDIEACEDLTAWQMLRFLHSNGELWNYAPGPVSERRGSIAEEFDTFFRGSSATENGDVRLIDKALNAGHLLGLLRTALAGYEAIQEAADQGRQKNPQGLEADRMVGARHRINEVKVVHLLHLAFGMALDPRRLPEVLAEGLGMDASVNASAIVDTLRQAVWQWNDNAVFLNLECDHQCLDAALEIHAKDLADDLIRLRRDAVLETHLPTEMPEFFGDRVVPGRDANGIQLYMRPHLAFELDSSRVRELLLGQNFYGDPSLAVRELYQNALDACRYRRARDRWLRKTGRLPSTKDPYQGSIWLRAREEDGRPYIECEDDGIGMGERHLRNLFARAGRRFTDTDELQLEQANWEEQGIQFYANSRFGIGVLSYFMLADELFVKTRRWLVGGRACEKTIRATLIGSGSLFQIQTLDSEYEPGTLVRLYLKQPELGSDKRDQTTLDPLRLLESVSEWLWLPEVETHIEGIEEVLLLGGQPSPEMTRKCGEIVPILEQGREGERERFWWSRKLIEKYATEKYATERIGRMRGFGASSCFVMVDGIRVAHGDDKELATGLAINLTEELSPVLAVDRSHIIDWSGAQGQLVALLRNQERAWRRLLDVPGIRLEHLGMLFENHPTLILDLDACLRSGDCRPTGLKWGSEDEGQHFLDATVGIFEADSGLWPRIKHDATGPRFDRNDTNRANATLKRARLAAFKCKGLQLPAPLAKLLELKYEPELPNPRAGVWTFINRFCRANPRHFAYPFFPPTSLRGEQMLARMAAFTAWLGKPGYEVADLLNSLSTLGLDLEIEQSDLDLLSGIGALGEPQLELLSYNLNGDAPWVDAIGHVQLARAARRWSLPLSEVARHASPLKKLGLVLPDLTPLQSVTAFDERLVILLAGVCGNNSWSRDPDVCDPASSIIGPSVLVRAAHFWSWPVRRVAELAGALKELGVIVPDAAAIPPNFEPSAKQAALLFYDLHDSDVPVDAIMLGQLVRAASRWSMTLGEVADLARPLAEIGVLLPNLDNIPKDLRISDLQEQLLSQRFNGRRPWIDHISPSRLVQAAFEWSKPLGEVIEIARPLAEIGMGSMEDLDRIPRNVDEDKLRSFGSDFRYPGNSPWLDDNGTIGLVQMIKRAASRREKLHNVFAKAKNLAELGFEVYEPPAEAISMLADNYRFDYALESLANEIDLDERYVDSLNLAFLCVETRQSPGDFLQLLHFLKALDFNVDECIDYASLWEGSQPTDMYDLVPLAGG